MKLTSLIFAGYSTGSIIKEHAQRQEFIDEFYATHPTTSRAEVKAEIFQLQSKRAVSLPDVLEEDHYAGYQYSKGRTRKTFSEKQQAKSSDDLLQF